MNRQTVRVRISLEMLGGLIGLPPTQRIVAVVPPTTHDVWTNTMEVMIEGEGLPDVPEGHIPTLADVEIHRDANGCPEAAVTF